VEGSGAICSALDSLMGSCALLDGKEASSPRTDGALSSSEVVYVGDQGTARMA
jgi:hypothetical protein